MFMITEFAARPRGLMDLSTELRLKIAEYALAYDDGLHAYPVSKSALYYRTKRPILGTEHMTNNDSPRYNALSFTCRQLWNETQDLPYQVNAITFRSQLLYLMFFLKRAPAHVLQKMQHIKIVFHLLHMKYGGFEHFTKGLTELLKKIPHVQVQLITVNWDSSKLLVQDWVDMGKEIEERTRILDSAGGVRRWRLFPNPVNESRLQFFRDVLDKDQLQKVLEWIKNGI
ncbi:hypothetical protein BDV96DRAFT_641095 [Lophiotrema nucula]|uniref:Uncharacterized protein n=1 Tax=Lophiotrema nucula TaxID=690887 RepID=A0A6A5ZN47_9PLEO|nr:hypothetical protein BDV96DRAFT_641095 [Lophiotrema nucula]